MHKMPSASAAYSKWVQVKNLVDTIKSHLQKSPDTIEKQPLRRAAHSLAELSKIGESFL